MRSHETSDRRVDHLVERLKDDSLSDSEVMEVTDIIRNQPRARRRLVNLLYLAAELRDVMENWQGLANPKVVSLGGRRRVWGVTALLAAAAAVALMVWQPWTSRTARGDHAGTTERVHDPASEAIAVITRVRDAKWSNESALSESRLKEGGLLAAGAVEIESGLIQIDFYSGATVILEGPAKFSLEAPDLGRLEYGNLWAHVPAPARGFKIESSAFDLVDLGTEFGMRVDRSGDGQVHVIKGEVEVYSKSSPAMRERLLKTGEGMKLGMDGSSQEINARPDWFIGSNQLDAEANENFKRWQVNRSRLRNDPDTLVYYDFQNLSNWDRTLANVATAGPSDTNGAIVGCKLVEGRWPGKGALAFENSSNRVRLNVPGAFEDLTMSCWLRVDDKTSRQMAILHPETQQDRFVHWSLINPKPGVLHPHFAQSYHDSKGDEVRVHYHADWNLLKKTSSESWIHLALVYDSKAGKVSHYEDGELIAINEIEVPRLLGIGIADIGNWPYHEWAKGTEWEVRNLVGAVDEFIISKRPYAALEIKRLWSEGRP